MKTIDVIKFDVATGFPVQMEIEDTLDAFHKEIGCETMQGLSNTELGLLYGLDVFLDDNGKLFGQDTISGLFVRDGEVIDFMVGNLLLARHDDEGETISVSPLDIINLPKHICAGECLRLAPDSKWKVAPNLLLLNC